MKNLYSAILIFLATTFLINAQNTCSPLFTNGIVVYYPFCGNADDQSGGTANGTVYGATLTEDRFGNAHSAYSFVGTSSYISIPNYLNAPSVNSFSVSIWLTNFQTSGGVHAFYHGAGAGEWSILSAGMGVHLSDGNWYWATGNLIDSNWTHLVGIYNKGVDMKVYRNGQLDTVTAIPNLDLFYTVGYYVTIGAYNIGAGGYWDGKIDDAYVYNRELTLSEIDSLYHLGGWVGITENTENRSITIYPNLTSGKFIVSCPNTFHNSTIKIFNALGEDVFYSAIINSETEIDLSNKAKGIYFVQVTSGTENWTEKILIK